MQGILWNKLHRSHKKEYIKFLKIFGALSGLFKETTDGIHAKKPYLYYRNHEQLFARVFNVEDLTRKDSAFDAIATIDNQRIGIGLKTWIHTRDYTFQKVAEFNKLAPIEIHPLIEEGDSNEVIKKISVLRNERIKLDKRQYGTENDIYHYITRDDHLMNIVESSYDLIQLDSLKLINETKSTYTFTDGLKNYKFYTSKSVLLEEFNASQANVITQVPITQFDDPFELLGMIDLPVSMEMSTEENVLYLPLYSDSKGEVEEKSGFNAWNAAPKSKGSNTPRPEFEAYITIPVWVHHIRPNFFGFDPLNKEENAGSFTLHLPDKRKIDARVTQSNGKSLQSNPQNILGKWILHDVLGLESRELLKKEHLLRLGVDSLKVTKLDDENYKIELAELHAFERWKLEERDKIEQLVAAKKLRRPKYREKLFVEDDIE